MVMPCRTEKSVDVKDTNVQQAADQDGNSGVVKDGTENDGKKEGGEGGQMLVKSNTSLKSIENKKEEKSNSGVKERRKGWWSRKENNTGGKENDAKNVAAVQSSVATHGIQEKGQADHLGTEKKQTGGRLCCGGRSVQVKDSLRPIDEVVKDEGKDDARGKEEEEDDDDNVSEEDEEEEAEDKQRGAESADEEDKKETDEEEEEFEEVNGKILVRQYPSRPSLKKKSKTKKSPNAYVGDEPPDKGGINLAFNSRKGKYSITPSEPEEATLYTQSVKAGNSPSKSPTKGQKKKKPSPQPPLEEQHQELMQTEAEREEKSPQKKKKKKKVPDADEDAEMRSVYESQMASLDAAPVTAVDLELSLSRQPTVEEEGDLLENAEEERRKNKQRLRERKRKEKEQTSPIKGDDSVGQAYEHAQKEIGRVLQPRTKKKEEEEDDEKKKKQKSKHKDKKKKEKKGEENAAYSSDEKKKDSEGEKEETLEDARNRMHKLLDDAFSLISQSRSSIGNQVEPARQSSEEGSSPRSTHSARCSRSQPSQKQHCPDSQGEPDKEEQLHTPLYVQRSHGAYDSSGLVTWSPYRASDDTALISLPHTQTNLSVLPPQHQKLATSTFNESLPHSLRANYYTTEPAPPIVIKSKHLDSNSQPWNQSQQGLAASGPNSSKNGSKASGVEPVTIPNPVYENSAQIHPMTSQSVDRYSEPYFSMASFHDLPQSTEILSSDVTAQVRPRMGPRLNTWVGEEARSAEGQGYVDVRAHTAPQRGGNQNLDVVDVISESVRPGASPQPLIDSLREELQSLSNRRIVGGATGAGEQSHRSGGSRQPRGLNHSASGWDSVAYQRRSEL